MALEHLHPHTHPSPFFSHVQRRAHLVLLLGRWRLGGGGRAVNSGGERSTVFGRMGAPNLSPYLGGNGMDGGSLKWEGRCNLRASPLDSLNFDSLKEFYGGERE